MRFYLLTAVIATAICFTAMPAGATPSSKAKAQQQIHLLLQKYYHADGYIKAIGRVAHRTIYSSNPRVRKRWRRDVHWLMRQRESAQARIDALRAPPGPRQLYGGAGHYAGWSCITNGSYPGAPHEGNGYNGKYTGPLGMSTPWMGHYPPGSDWVHSNVADVYAIAEHEAAQRHFSYQWMQGQWPETFPPCAKYFTRG